MTDKAQLEEKMWKAIEDDRTVMLGLDGKSDGHAQPMTVQFDGPAMRGPLYIFTAKDTDLVQELGGHGPASIHFVAKNHGLFACLQGMLTADNDRETIDRLWNRFVAAWFEGGRDDPKLQLLRFEPHHAQIWENENSLFAGVKIMLGSDPKEDYKDKVADVRM